MQSPPHETLEIDSAGPLPFLQEQRRDQEAAQYEEDIDADKSAVGKAKVKADDQ